MAATATGQKEDDGLIVQQHRVDDENASYSSKQNASSQVHSKLGIPQRKRWIHTSDTAIILCAWACFAAAIITVQATAGYRSIPWNLGVTRQFQIIGVLLSLMYQCFRVVAPKLFLLLEACLGSYLQNYEAILRNSFLKPKTHPVWRAILLFLILIPLGLSVAYKSFDHGVGCSDRLSAGNFYGMTPPAGIDNTEIGHIGLSIMANSTLPFASATFNDPNFPLFPKAYGFNILLLSNTSSARLDCPVPEYLQELQGQMTIGETYTLTADVHGVVTTYNDSIETHRDDDNFWNYYLSMTGDNRDRYISASDPSMKDAFLLSELDSRDMFNSYSLYLLMNDLRVLNTSWAFATFLNVSAGRGPSDAKATAFRSSAMLFQTRRESCRGTWTITYNSIQLTNGSCDGSPLPDQSQLMFTNTTLALPTWYMPMLCEYLQAFADTRSASQWKMPSFTTVIAGMYWSRVSKLIGPQNEDHGQSPQEVYYYVRDRLVSERPVMNTSFWLFFVLAVFPVLTTLAFLGCLVLYRVPLDGGAFGTVALLAGVRPDTLALLDGASLSGNLKRPLGVRFNVHEPMLFEGQSRKGEPQVEYILTNNAHDGGGVNPLGRQKVADGLKYRPVESGSTDVPPVDAM